MQEKAEVSITQLITITMLNEPDKAALSELLSHLKEDIPIGIPLPNNFPNKKLIETLAELDPDTINLNQLNRTKDKLFCKTAPLIDYLQEKLKNDD